MRSRYFQCLVATMVAVVAGCAGPEHTLRGGSSHSWPGLLLLSALPGEQGRPPCGGQRVPEGWPELPTSREVLAPLLRCSLPAEFIALQRGVDMARLVEQLDDWSAVRLGAQGPLVSGADILQRKRAAFLVAAVREYGLAQGEVFALFVLHTAFTEEVREVLVLLAGEKLLGQTLGRMGAVRAELERRGLRLSAFADRGERPGDVLRGLGSAARDALSSTPIRDGASYLEFSTRRGQLPPPYQQALDEVEAAQMEEHFTPGGMALGSFDTLTFGVPLGFYHLAAGTGQGVDSLRQGQYEQATRELVPAALLVALYAGGKGMRSLPEARRAVGARWERIRLQGAELRLQALQEVAERLRERLGEEGVGQVAKYLQTSREAALLVGAGGEPAAVALHAARGEVARAQAWLSQTKPEPAGPSGPMGGPAPKKAGAGSARGSVAALVDEGAGLTPEVLQAKLLRAEVEATGPRLPADVAWLEQQRAVLDAPHPGVPEGSGLWGEYVAYRERRLAELKTGQRAEGPLRWESYERMRGLFARGLAFERAMVALLRADAALPRAQRRWLRDFHQPRIETYVGVAKEGQPGVRFADVLVIEQQAPAGQPPRVETFSFKSRNLSLMKTDPLTAQMKKDASDALAYYGETLNLRRPSLKYLGSEVQVRRVRLIYEGGSLKPQNLDAWQTAVERVHGDVKGVEVLVQ